MNFKFRKFQEGGEMPAPEAQPAQEENPIMQLAQMATQAIQAGDCNMAMQVCQGFVQMVQSSQGAAPAPEQTEPVYRRGGTLIKRIRK